MLSVLHVVDFIETILHTKVLINTIDWHTLVYAVTARIKLMNKTRCRAIAGRTARCRYKFRHNGIVHAVTVVQHGFLV